MSKNLPGEQGSLHLLSLLLVAGIVGTLVSSQMSVTRNYFDGRSNVAGVYTSINSVTKATPGASKSDARVITDNGKTAVVSAVSGAVSNFPLKIDPKTNVLIVTTPAGVKTVTILPDQAIKNMLAAGVMSYVTSIPVTGELGSVRNVITLEEDNGLLVYRINGVREHSLLGIVPIKTSVTAVVSAENGQVVKTQQSLLGRILNRIAP